MNKQEMHDFIERQQPNICQIVAVRGNQTVYSDTWNNYKSDDCVHVMSVTKSVMALLIGIAIDKGQITKKFWIIFLITRSSAAKKRFMK